MSFETNCPTVCCTTWETYSSLLLEVPAFQDLPALPVDHLALGVHDLVVLEHVLADLEVLLLDVLLCGLDGPSDQLGLDGFVLRPVESVHDLSDPVRGEQAHQVVAEGQIEARLTRIPLAAGPAS